MISRFCKHLFTISIIAIFIDVMISAYFNPLLPIETHSSYYFPVPAIFVTGITICFVHMGLVPATLAMSYGNYAKAIKNISLSAVATVPCVIAGAVASCVICFIAFILLLLISIPFGGAMNLSGMSVEASGKAVGGLVVTGALEIAFATGAVSCLVLARRIQNIVMKDEYMPPENVVIRAAVVGALISGLLLQVSATSTSNLPFATGISGLAFMAVWMASNACRKGEWKGQ